MEKYFFQEVLFPSGLPQDFENEIPELSRTFWDGFPELFQDFWDGFSGTYFISLMRFRNLIESYCAAKRHENFCWKVTIKAGYPFILRKTRKDWLDFKLFFQNFPGFWIRKSRTFPELLPNLQNFGTFPELSRMPIFFPEFPELSRTRGNPGTRMTVSGAHSPPVYCDPAPRFSGTRTHAWPFQDNQTAS